jgi:hypothetical protein
MGLIRKRSYDGEIVLGPLDVELTEPIAGK